MIVLQLQENNFDDSCAFLPAKAKMRPPLLCISCSCISSSISLILSLSMSGHIERGSLNNKKYKKKMDKFTSFLPFRAYVALFSNFCAFCYFGSKYTLFPFFTAPFLLDCELNGVPLE